MNLVIQTNGSKGKLLGNPTIKGILAPFHPVSLEQPLYLDNKCYNYIAISDTDNLDILIDQLMQIDGVESVYEKPLDFPPM